MNYSYLYYLFLYYFNVRRDYYECHDVLEELWLDEGRDRFYQGLLQIAVGLYHFKWNNKEGAILLLEGAISKLQPYPDIHGGIHLKKIRQEAEEYLDKIRNYKEKPFSFYDLTIEILDKELIDAVHEIEKGVNGGDGRCP